MVLFSSLKTVDSEGSWSALGRAERVFCFPLVPPEPLSTKDRRQDGEEKGFGDAGERDINPQLCDDVL